MPAALIAGAAVPALIPDADVSKNIHVLPVPLPAALPVPSFAPNRPSPRWRSPGIAVAAVVVVACAAIGIFSGATSGRRQAETASPPALATGSPLPGSSRVASATPSPPPARATAKAPVAETARLPTRSHIEITVQAEDATLVLDGEVIRATQLKLDVPPDKTAHVLEVAAPGFARFRRSVSFAKDLYLTIELQRAPPPTRVGVRPGAKPVAAKPKKHVRAQAIAKPTGARAIATPTDDFGSPFEPTR